MFRPVLATLSCELTKWGSYTTSAGLALLRPAVVVLALALLVLSWLIVMPLLGLIRQFMFSPSREELLNRV